MQWEKVAARELDLDWDVELVCPKTIDPFDVCIQLNPLHIKIFPKLLAAFIKGFSIRNRYYKRLTQLQDKYDIIILRYLPFEIHQYLFVRSARVPIYLVHHTLEIEELKTIKSSFSQVKLNLERLLGRKTIRAAAGIIGVTNEIRCYELERAKLKTKTSFIYPNGVFLGGKELIDHRKGRPEIIFVASEFYPWHGLDLLLNSIECSDSSFILHLVGRVPPEMHSAIEADARIIRHSNMNSEQISKLCETCWVGLSSFALDRKGMNEACTLKVREYLSMGLPVYSGHKDVFPSDFEYYKNGDCSIEDILSFAILMKQVEKYQIRESSTTYIEKRVLLQNLHAALEGNEQSQKHLHQDN